jgi:hypothetical protein
LIFLLGITLFLVKNCQAQKDTTNPEKKAPTVNRNRGFDRRIAYLDYTAHARCRMDCRQISKEEVEEIMKTGKVNYSKSNVKANPCPAYALEGETSDDQFVRIVFGQCDTKTKVITVIDLRTDWTCACPGDDDKYKNRK